MIDCSAKRGGNPSLGGFFFGGEGGAVAPWGLRGEEEWRRRGRGRALGTTGGGDCLGLFSIVYCF